MSTLTLAFVANSAYDRVGPKSCRKLARHPVARESTNSDSPTRAHGFAPANYTSPARARRRRWNSRSRGSVQNSTVLQLTAKDGIAILVKVDAASTQSPAAPNPRTSNVVIIFLQWGVWSGRLRSTPRLPPRPAGQGNRGRWGGPRVSARIRTRHDWPGSA
jgi:hypothetical protein